MSDDFAAEQFEMLLGTLVTAGYEQYEISNFCLPGGESQHNSNYWRKEKYLGLGPGAHSYNGSSRQYNVSNNGLYLKALAQDEIPAELDELQPHDQANEYIMTGLRTKWGIDLKKIRQEFGFDLYKENYAYLHQLQNEGKIRMQGQQLILTNSGKLLADRIASDLFVVN
jgi:oxygen-independent coproporphyrinogen-3 oxidase